MEGRRKRDKPFQVHDLFFSQDDVESFIFFGSVVLLPSFYFAEALHLWVTPCTFSYTYACCGNFHKALPEPKNDLTPEEKDGIMVIQKHNSFQVYGLVNEVRVLIRGNIHKKMTPPVSRSMSFDDSSHGGGDFGSMERNVPNLIIPKSEHSIDFDPEWGDCVVVAIQGYTMDSCPAEGQVISLYNMSTQLHAHALHEDAIASDILVGLALQTKGNFSQAQEAFSRARDHELKLALTDEKHMSASQGAEKVKWQSLLCKKLTRLAHISVRIASASRSSVDRQTQLEAMEAALHFAARASNLSAENVGPVDPAQKQSPSSSCSSSTTATTMPSQIATSQTSSPSTSPSSSALYETNARGENSLSLQTLSSLGPTLEQAFLSHYSTVLNNSADYRSNLQALQPSLVKYLIHLLHSWDKSLRLAAGRLLVTLLTSLSLSLAPVLPFLIQNTLETFPHNDERRHEALEISEGAGEESFSQTQTEGPMRACTEVERPPLLDAREKNRDAKLVNLYHRLLAFSVHFVSNSHPRIARATIDSLGQFLPVLFPASLLSAPKPKDIPFLASGQLAELPPLPWQASLISPPSTPVALSAPLQLHEAMSPKDAQIAGIDSDHRHNTELAADSERLSGARVSILHLISLLIESVGVSAFPPIDTRHISAVLIGLNDLHVETRRAAAVAWTLLTDLYPQSINNRSHSGVVAIAPTYQKFPLKEPRFAQVFQFPKERYSQASGTKELTQLTRWCQATLGLLLGGSSLRQDYWWVWWYGPHSSLLTAAPLEKFPLNLVTKVALVLEFLRNCLHQRVKRKEQRTSTTEASTKEGSSVSRERAIFQEFHHTQFAKLANLLAGLLQTECSRREIASLPFFSLLWYCLDSCLRLASSEEVSESSSVSLHIHMCRDDSKTAAMSGVVGPLIRFPFIDSPKMHFHSFPDATAYDTQPQSVEPSQAINAYAIPFLSLALRSLQKSSPRVSLVSAIRVVISLLDKESSSLSPLVFNIMEALCRWIPDRVSDDVFKLFSELCGRFLRMEAKLPEHLLPKILVAFFHRMVEVNPLYGRKTDKASAGPSVNDEYDAQGLRKETKAYVQARRALFDLILQSPRLFHQMMDQCLLAVPPATTHATKDAITPTEPSMSPTSTSPRATLRQFVQQKRLQLDHDPRSKAQKVLLLIQRLSFLAECLSRIDFAHDGCSVAQRDQLKRALREHSADPSTQRQRVGLMDLVCECLLPRHAFISSACQALSQHAHVDVRTEASRIMYNVILCIQCAHRCHKLCPHPRSLSHPIEHITPQTSAPGVPSLSRPQAVVDARVYSFSPSPEVKTSIYNVATSPASKISFSQWISVSLTKYYFCNQECRRGASKAPFLSCLCFEAFSLPHLVFINFFAFLGCRLFSVSWNFFVLC